MVGRVKWEHSQSLTFEVSKKFIFHTPFSRKQWEDMLHKNKGVNQEQGRHGDQNKRGAKGSPGLKEESSDPWTAAHLGYRIKQSIVAYQKALKRVLQEDKIDRMLGVFKYDNKRSFSATWSTVGRLVRSMNCSRNIFLVVFYKRIYLWQIRN